MMTFKIQPTDYKEILIDEVNKIRVMKKGAFESFNESILGLGQIETKSTQINALSIMFDLEGFTNFCKQIDPQLAVPEYLSKFLKWLFQQIRLELIEKEHIDGYQTYADFPFQSKFLGDGVLFLWNTEGMDDTRIRNVVVSMYEICKKYQLNFLPSIVGDIVSPPTKLRCGIARGAIYSVGNGNDYVGPCINMSARLQKLHSLSFCFSRRGIDPNQMDDSYKRDFIVKKTNIRGIGDDELVCILKTEYDKLAKADKVNFFNI